MNIFKKWKALDNTNKFYYKSLSAVAIFIVAVIIGYGLRAPTTNADTACYTCQYTRIYIDGNHSVTSEPTPTYLDGVQLLCGK